MRPVSERVRDLVTGAVIGRRDMQQIIDEVQALERLNSARTVHIAANGKFPRFSLDRWIAIVGAVAAILSAAFVAGGRWWAVETAAGDIKVLKGDIAVIHEEVSAIHGQVTIVTAKVEQNREAVDHRLNEISDSVSRAEQEARNAASSVQRLAIGASGRGRGGHP